MIIPEAFRKRRNYYFAEVTELLAGLLRTYARWKAPGAAMPPQQWRRALILGSDHVGDVLYRSGSLEPLKRGLPECDFYYLAAPGSADVIDKCPWLKRVFRFERDKSGRVSKEALDTLRDIGFDAAISSNAGTYQWDLLLALRLGIPSRAGFTGKGFSAWVTHPVPLRYPSPFPVYFRDMVAALTGHEPAWPARPRVFFDETDEAVAQRFVEELGLDPARPVMACFLTSRQPNGVWPPDCFGRAVQIVASKAPVQVVLCGARSDEPLLTHIDREFALGAQINAGRIGLRPLARFLARCAVVLTTDSGPRHLANSAGAPTVFIRNLRFNKVEAGVYCDTEYDMAPDSECVPRAEQDRELRKTTPEMVANKVLEIVAHSTR
jgi:ADP-heptose:LPS heptosyltransferase